MSHQQKLFEREPEFNGNRKLVEHGIQTENSDYRAHVVYPDHVYVFPTGPALAIAPNYPSKNASVPGSNIITGVGRPVPISHIPELQDILIPVQVSEAYKIFRTDSTSIKGARAVQIVLWMLKHGRIALKMIGKEVLSTAQQIEGSDIVVVANQRIQVKCDLPAAKTGNLFLQFRECNVGRLY
jgi:hypothetical protein